MAAIVLIIWTLLILLITTAVRKFNNWWYEPNEKSLAAPLPPGDLGWPIFGHMYSFLRAYTSSNPNAFTDSYLEKYGKLGLYKTHLFSQPTILTTSSDAYKWVTAHGDHFLPGWPDSFNMLFGCNSISLLAGDKHKRMKRLTGPSLQGTDTLARFALQIAEEDVRELETWAREKVINTYDAVTKLIFDRMMKILISCEERSELDEIARIFSKFILAVRAIPINLPGTAHHKGLKARQRLREKLTPVISRRRAGERKDDVLQLWMDQSDDDGQPMTDEELLDMIGGYMIAGHTGSALSLTWFMIFMNEHPEVLEKVRVEAQEVRNTKPPGEPLSYFDTRRLKYLRHVHDEILRIVNIAPFTFRKGRLLKPGQFAAFGEGQRACPGQQFARLNVVIIAYYLALDYK
ncbi:hypothetical protein AXG93_3217s1630 [Marchantia polymorpha subsp. ruderalis]|uniref:Cytochrome P450 n=1 Tax=Marchantia polymorpha subsp. ruderalis TaxID=1480154 RepID=A0A176VZ27_MARPO|nr:hypothetical protein AXG93_3217s1630 [Marchantia polymorpha subsp. ruderalis]